MLSIAASTCTRRLLHCTCLELSPGCAACTSPFTTTVYDTVQRGTGGIKMTLWTDRSYGGRDSCALCKVPFRLPRCARNGANADFRDRHATNPHLHFTSGPYVAVSPIPSCHYPYYLFQGLPLPSPYRRLGILAFLHVFTIKLTSLPKSLSSHCANPTLVPRRSHRSRISYSLTFPSLLLSPWTTLLKLSQRRSFTCSDNLRYGEPTKTPRNSTHPRRSALRP